MNSKLVLCIVLLKPIVGQDGLNDTLKSGVEEKIIDESNKTKTKPINGYGRNISTGGNNSNDNLYTNENNNDHANNNNHLSDTFSHLGPHWFAFEVSMSINDE